VIGMENVQPEQVQDAEGAGQTKARPTRNRRSARAAGSSFESLIASGLAALLDDDRIERRTKNGSKDRGDITGVKTIRGGRVVIECKDVKVQALPAWLREAEAERGNDDAAIGVVAHKRSRSAKPEEQYISMTLATFALLLEGGSPL
jgi:hypothetical protein